MNAEALKTILTEQLGAEQDGSEFRLSGDRDVAALLKSGAEIVHVTDLELVEFDSNVATLVTRRAEYFVEPTDVFAVKLDGSRVQPGEARPGFRRDDS